MRKFLTCLPILVALAAATAWGADSSKPFRPKNGGTQVMFVLVASALIYCESGRWPATIQEILAYRKRTGFRADLKIQDKWLLSSQVRLVVEPGFVLRARDYVDHEYVIVEAKQSVPHCEKGKVDIPDADMHIGPDGEV